MKIRTRVYPIIVKLDKLSYIIVLQTLFGNIIYDDNLDHILITLQQQSTSGYDLDFKADFDRLAIFAIEEKAVNYPFMRVALDRCRIEFYKKKDKTNII